MHSKFLSLLAPLQCDLGLSPLQCAVSERNPTSLILDEDDTFETMMESGYCMMMWREKSWR
jgi:hypothetical protein